jgi:hypothetical protein
MTFRFTYELQAGSQIIKYRQISQEALISGLKHMSCS